MMITLSAQDLRVKQIVEGAAVGQSAERIGQGHPFHFGMQVRVIDGHCHRTGQRVQQTEIVFIERHISIGFNVDHAQYEIFF